MAVAAFGSQIFLVLIVFGVAAIAVFGRLFVHRALVTLLALHLGVLAKQGEVALVMVELGNVFPVLFCVATCTVFPQGFFVLVVLHVAGIALLTGLLFVQITRMAIFASRLLVLSAQYIFRIYIVIERGGLPMLVIVASLALLPVQAFVTLLVVYPFVAGVAVFRRVFVVIVLVTVRALHIDVFARQWKLGSVVIEPRFFPVRLGVTVAAFGA